MADNLLVAVTAGRYGLSRPIVNSVLLLAAVAAVGCAGRGGAASDYGGIQSIRAVGACAPEVSPTGLPPAEALVDTAMLGPGLRDLMRESDTSGGYAVLTMEYMADGTNVRRDLLEHDLDPETADSLQELVYAARRELPDAEEDRGARLRIDLAPEIRYSVSPRQRCEPAPRSAAIEQAMREYTGTGTRRRGGARTRVVLVRVTVHPAGYVAGAAILRGADRGGTLERDLERFVEQFSFEPATIDGIPTYGYIDVPIHVRY